MAAKCPYCPVLKNLRNTDSLSSFHPSPSPSVKTDSVSVDIILSPILVSAEVAD